MAETKEKAAEVAQDQSMEEILQSIRRIIAEENDDVTAEPDASPAASAPSDTLAGSDVLELTEIVAEGTPPASAKTDILSAIDTAIAPRAEEKKPQPLRPEPLRMEPLRPEPPPAPPPLREEKATPQPVTAAMKDDAPKDTGEGLISRASAEAAATALRSLSESAARRPHAGGSPAFRSGTTVEDLAMEALRPMLKDWLDANLPGLVERIVQREIRKLADRSE